MVPDDLLYTEDHEWIRDDGGEYVVGITAWASEQLGELTFVELPEIGMDVHQGESVGVVESVKAASDIYSPVSGHIVEVNEALEDDPGAVTKDPYGDGWLFKLDSIRVADLKRLMKPDAYGKYLEDHTE